MTEVRYGQSRWDDWGRLPRGYERRLQHIDGQGIYWHLYCRGERVNGGLAGSEVCAVEESRRLAWVHLYFREDRPGRLSGGDLGRVLRYGEDPSAWGWDD